MRRQTTVLVAAVFGLTIGAERAASEPIHALGDSSTASFLQGVATGQTPRGWDFQINAPDIQVVQLGVNAATTATTITLSLWDNTTQTLLAQTTAISSAQAWVFVDLGTPVSLMSGREYSVIGWADTGGSGNPWYLFNNDPPPGFNPTGTIQYIDGRFDNFIGPDTFPTETFLGSAQYGVTDIGYQSAVPEPATFTLAVTAVLIGGGYWWRCRRRATA